MSEESLTAGSFELDVLIAADSQRVWNAIATEASSWWPKDFVTSERTQRFVIEVELGGRAFEDFGNGDGLVWYSVIGVDAPRELVLAGHLLPPFGGPAITSLRITLVSQDGGTLLKIRDDRFGMLGGQSPIEGWRSVFDGGLRRYVESHSS
ncbi:MAG: SRPBCC family protein [Pirellula sp.]